MTISLDIPDDLVASLGSTPSEQGQLVREALAVHLYREGRISMRAMGRMAGIGEDYWSADAFRERHQLPVQLPAASDEDAALDVLRKQG
jgi:predicted HTH domain antitoxin